MRVFLVLALGIALCGSQSALGASQDRGPCPRYRHHHGGVVSDVKACIRHSVHRWHVPGGKGRALHVAKCESSFHPGEDYGRFSGVYQIGDTEWRTWPRPQHYRRWFHGWPGPHNGAANIITAIFHAHHVGFSAWACA